MKYIKPKEFAILKKYITVVGNGDVTPLLEYNNYRQRALEMSDKLIGLTTGDGIVITDYSAHSVACSIGYVSIENIHLMRQGVSVDEIARVLNGMGCIRHNSPVYELNGIKVSVNTNDGIIIQVNPENWNVKK